MRALDILQEKLRPHAQKLHSKRWSAIWRVVRGAIDARELWLTGIGRAVAGPELARHRLKVVDRLLGSAAIQASLPTLHRAVASYLLEKISSPVLLVDWTCVGSKFHVLSAQLLFRGRSLPLLSKAFPTSLKCSPVAQNAFLAELRAVIPAAITPILVTDAGFHLQWFDEALRHGFDYVGRIRSKLTIDVDGSWLPLEDVHALARRKPIDLGVRAVGKGHSTLRRVVLASEPNLKGRQRFTTSGTRRHRTADRQRSCAAREPWVLLTSLAAPARRVIQIYDGRMQVEQTFRDLKNHRFGWSLADSRCRSAGRLDVLLLVATLALVVMHAVGIAARASNMVRYFQVNTERRREIFSTVFLAGLVLDRGLHRLLKALDLNRAFDDLLTTLRLVSL